MSSMMMGKDWVNLLRDWCSSTVVVVGLTCVLGYSVYKRMSNKDIHSRRRRAAKGMLDETPKLKQLAPPPDQLCEFYLTKAELAEYNSRNPHARYLVAFMGLIFDVSDAIELFGPHGYFEELTGTDISECHKVPDTPDISELNKLRKECKDFIEDKSFVVGSLIEPVTNGQKQPEESDNESFYTMKGARGMGAELTSNSSFESLVGSLMEETLKPDQTIDEEVEPSEELTLEDSHDSREEIGDETLVPSPSPSP